MGKHRNLFQIVKTIWRSLDPASLQFRLTAGATAVSVLGVSSFAVWMSIRTEQILIGSHKQYVVNVATQLAEDVALYEDVMSSDEAIQKAVNFRTLPDLTILIIRPDGSVLAQSPGIQAQNQLQFQLKSLSEEWIDAQVISVAGQHFVVCTGPFAIKNSLLGQLYVAQNVTGDLTMFQEVLQSLGIATLLIIVLTSVVIALYVQRSLHPLRQAGQLAETISVKDLSTAKLHLQQAPTEVNELMQTCESMMMRLSRAVEQQQQFIHDISHELRTPLTIVYGYLQSMLRRGKSLTEPQREALETAASEADRTIQILQDLLDLARADSGYLMFDLQPLSLNPLLKELVSMAEASSDRSFLLEASHDDIQVWADAGRLKQVLSNLIDNALKYSGPDQPITVRLDHQAGDAIIQVCDCGQGIPLQHQSRIFDRCYRVDEARSRSTGGCGLGLSLVKTLVEGMGGSVTVRSKVNEGSVFTIILPSPPGKS